MLEYHVLGELRAVRDGDQLHVGGPRQRRLLAMLLVHGNEVVSTDRLVEAVFAGNPTPAAATTLRSYVARLRKVLDDDGRGGLADGDGAAALQTVSPGYRLHVADDALDAVRFEHLVDEGRTCRAHGDPEGAASALRQALDLWDGDAYAEFEGEGWVMPEAQRLAELRSVTEQQLADAELECGLAAELVPRLEVLVDREPLREPFRAKLMVALYRSGRQADALAVMRDYRQALGRQAGLDPSPQLEELAQQILAQDEELQQVGPPARLVRGYRLGERLGSGRDGTVHAARLPGVDRDLVIRIVPAAIADRPDVVRSFDSTMRRVAALHHDAIVPIDDHWREPGRACAVLRRMRGGTLRHRLESGPLGSTEVGALAARIGSALQAAAQLGIVHGRVIPESILFDAAGKAHLSDFPLGAADGDHDDDVVAFTRLLHEALTGTPEVDTDQAAPPGTTVLRHVLSGHSPGSIAQLVAEFERDANPGATAPGRRPDNPYKGLRAFDEADAADFFGREQLIAEMIARLSSDGSANQHADGGPAGRLVLVVGASGSGKSSAVRAGLLPRVRAGSIPGSEQWFVTSMIPGAAPFEELAEGLARVATASGVRAGDHRQVRLADELAADDRGIAAVVQRTVPEGGQLLLVVDQLEELFTLAHEKVQRAFLNGLLHALSDANGQLRVVATLRGDFYDRPLGFPQFGAAVRDATVTVPAMTASELEAAIRGPADRVGLQVEDPLVTELVTAVVDQPAAMPSLQFTLYELATTANDAGLQLAAYHDLGGVGGAIARRAEDLYASIDDDHDLVRHVFEQLIVIGPEGHPTRRPAIRSELSTASGGRPIQEVIDPWVQARLLSTDRHPETREPTVEVAHEALLREWPRLRDWIEADRTSIVAAGQVREAAASWEALDRDPGALYRGTKLDAALEQLGGRTDTLPGTAREFLDASTTARDDRRAREAERVAQQARTNRRLRRQLAALAGAMVVSLVGGLVALDQRGQAQEQASLAQEQVQLAQDAAARAEAEERVAAARELAAASVAVVDEDPELSILLALEAVARTRVVDGSVLPEAEGALHRAVTQSRIVMSVPGLGGSVDWSPDGTVFVTEGPEESGLVDIRDAETGERVRAFAGHDADINVVGFSHDGALLATTGDDGLVRVWDTETAALRAEFRGDGQAWGLAFSPDGSRLAATWPDEDMVRVFDLARGESHLEVPASTIDLTESTSFGPNGDQLAIAALDRGVVVVDVDTGDEVLTIPTPDLTLAVAWSPDGRWIASGHNGGLTRLTDAATGERHVDIVGHSGEVRFFDWHRDATRLATGGRDGSARVWEITQDRATELVAVAARGAQGALAGVAFSPDGQRLLTGDTVVTAANIWEVGVAGGAQWVNIPVSTKVLPAAAFIPDGTALVVTGDGVPAVVWDLATGQPRRTLGADEGGAFKIEVDPLGELVATISYDPPPGVHVWDEATGTEVFSVREDDFFPAFLAWSPRGDHLAVSGFFQDGRPGKILVVDRTGHLVTELVEDDGFSPNGMDFGPDGERLLAGRQAVARQDMSIDGARVWDWARGQALMDLPVSANHVAFDPTGTRIVTGVTGLGASLWDAASGAPLATLTGHTGDVHDVVFSPDGDTVATAGTDGTVRLWSTETGTEQLVLRGHDGPVWSVAFSPDGQRLASVGDRMARVWTLDLDVLVGIAQDRLTRSLTDDECRQYLHVESCPA